ncbi:hypothetical protein PIB30_037833 [Stylosanthes scabra]|uniref:Uncharacterized protein n=1 Tax=Stylosanthes scabra TaxID=79078 RepID=A0ABU6SEB5_9FABA|nr:hypothetical protein [Stylosanthes scabra]
MPRGLEKLSALKNCFWGFAKRVPRWIGSRMISRSTFGTIEKLPCISISGSSLKESVIHHRRLPAHQWVYHVRGDDEEDVTQELNKDNLANAIEECAMEIVEGTPTFSLGGWDMVSYGRGSEEGFRIYRVGTVSTSYDSLFATPYYDDLSTASDPAIRE